MAAKKKTSPEQRKEVVKETLITEKKEEITVKINVISDFGDFIAGKTYKVTAEQKKKLAVLGAL